MQITPANLESRWPVIATILAVLSLLEGLPERMRLFPGWLPYTIAFLEIVPIVLVRVTSGKPLWLQVERIVTLLFCIVTVIITLLHLQELVMFMVSRSGEISGFQLLTTGIAAWIINLLAFSLLFWQIDRGGPGARSLQQNRKPDWYFPQENSSEKEKAVEWQPVFVDYLFLGYCTATAFSPTDALPLTRRAKLLIMIESTISLVTIVIVLSRAINTLGN